MSTVFTPGAAARRLAAALILAALAGGCSDGGEPIGVPGVSPGSPTSDAVIDTLLPARTVVGDSVRVQGSGFGPDSSGASFRFPSGSGSTLPAIVLSWSDTQLVVLVPEGAAKGATRFERDGAGAMGPEFDTAPRRISYSIDLVPVLELWGCSSCHGGSGNLNVQPWESLLAGTSDHGPAVIPRDSGASLLVQRVRPETPMLLRMPQGGPYLDPATIRLLADWVDQGARND